MILIADAGGTKIEWALIDSDGTTLMRTTTRGHNAVHADTQTLVDMLHAEAPALYAEAQGVDEIFYYGAGCAGERKITVARTLSEIFHAGTCHAESDMLGAAQALCGRNEGIACILGTGSNSCHYDGIKITANVSPLGFILGDEGSGAVLGRRLIGMVFKRGFSKEICDKFQWRFPEDSINRIITSVYRGERPNAYLASFVPFLAENIDDNEISDFVTDEFIRFFRFNISAYSQAQSLPIHFTGSVAHHFSAQLRSAADTLGYTIGNILKNPMDSLIAFHLENQGRNK
ncbi:MAG: ATPase [Duncaniella sp.]|nr:ATPase [Duncaniella sp.]MDE5953495.1 ATPase [Duncaniella sp.]MDE6188435.1 ATPase [Duncaniella sp.]